MRPLGIRGEQQEMEIAVAFCDGFGIGKDGKLPWHAPKDLLRFKRLTEGAAVVMGRKTFESLPGPQALGALGSQSGPLPGRHIIVICGDPAARSAASAGTGADVTFTSMRGVYDEIKKHKRVVVAGGHDVYRHFMCRARLLHVTHVAGKHECDTFFPTEFFGDFALRAHERDPDDGRLTYLTYHNVRGVEHPEHAYLDLLIDIMGTGRNRDDRTGTGTRSVFGRQMRFDISHSVPALTTKQVPWKSIVKELLWFLRGDTDAKKLAGEGVRIWDGNSSRAFLDARGLSHYEEGDVGPMYGHVWRHFGAEYRGCSHDYAGQGKDQLLEIVRLLREEPTSRRLVMTTHDPSALDLGALHPCHGLVTQFYVDGEHLSCHMYQRSMDTFLGAVWNILSYSVLTYILAAKAGLKPKDLVISTGDTHVYRDHFQAVEEQLTRTPYPFPKLVLADAVKDKAFEELTPDDFDLVGYFCHPAIRAKMSV